MSGKSVYTVNCSQNLSLENSVLIHNTPSRQLTIIKGTQLDTVDYFNILAILKLDNIFKLRIAEFTYKIIIKHETKYSKGFLPVYYF